MELEKIEGLSLAELLVALGILTLLVAISLPSYLGFKKSQELESEMTKIVATTREAMERSKSQADGSQWGMHFANPSGSGNDFYEIWKGTSYASGIVTGKIALGANVRFTDPAESLTKDVIFTKATGLPVASATILIESLTGAGTGTITIDPSVRISYSLN